MLKLLLAEPSREEAGRLALHVPWQELGFELLISETEPKLLKENLAAFSPDILLLDVGDDQMRSFPLIQHVRKEIPGIHVLLLSPAWPFRLLKTAMQTGADDFLVSPADIDELCEALQRLEVTCMAEKESRRTRKSILSMGIAQRLSGTGAQLYSPGELAGLISAYFEKEESPGSAYYLSFISVGEYRYILQNREILGFSAAEVLEEIQHVTEFVSGMLIPLPTNNYLLIREQPQSDALEQWQSQGGDVSEFISVIYDERPSIPSEIPEKQKEFRVLRNNIMLLHGSGKMLELAEARAIGSELISGKLFSFDTQKLVQALISGDAETAQLELGRFFDENICENIHILTVELVERIDRELHHQSDQITFSSRRKSLLIKRLLDVESAGMLLQMMQTYLDDLMIPVSQRENGFHDRFVRAVTDYIHQHCGEPFTVEELAAELHYSPNHLRYIFKKATGHTLSEEIYNLRMDRARRLLEETTLRVHEISQRVGYVNPSYFISQFLKRYGVTPVQYRRQTGG